jgi:hypothetical protein
MKQNYSSLLNTLSSSFTTIFPNGNDFLFNDVASLCQDKIKSTRGNFQHVFLLLLAVSFGQQSIAKNTTTTIVSSQKIIINHILFSSLAEGRGGGGGHGNDDWVIRHPLDVYHVDLVSKNLNTNNLNFYEYEK